MRTSKTTKKLTEYIVFPLAFFLSGILFLYLALSPYINLVLSGWALFSSDSDIAFGEEIHNDIFGIEKIELVEDYIPSSKVTYPLNGTKYAEITVTDTETEYVIPLYFGDNSKILRKGAGQYMGSHFPGEGSTILVSGHNNTFFNCLKYVEIGDVIKLETNYGVYLYEVIETAVKKNTDSSAYDLKADHENLVLYTCYPFNQLGLTPNRFFVYTRLVSGPTVRLDK